MRNVKTGLTIHFSRGCEIEKPLYKKSSNRG